jgi:hypothetical protein
LLAGTWQEEPRRSTTIKHRQPEEASEVKLRLSALAVLLALVTVSLFAPATGHEVLAATNPFKSIAITNAPVSGNTTGTFTGTLSINQFAVQNGKLVGLGTLNGTVTPTGGPAIPITNQAVTVPVQPTATCQILTLDLGPLHLDLLGLVIDLSAVHLSITAVQAPGNLLGNLLCAIAHLLDNPASPLAGVAALLNNILRLLG